MTTTSLVTALTIEQPTTTRRMQDIPVEINRMATGLTDLVFAAPTLKVTVRLNPAERISLIEALGGRA